MKSYFREHLWISSNEGMVYLGLTNYAIKSLGKVFYLQFFIKNQSNAKQNQLLAVLESTKIAWEILLPCEIKNILINQNLENNFDLLNNYPEDGGYLCKFFLDNFEHNSSILMSLENYLDYIKNL